MGSRGSAGPLPGPGTSLLACERAAAPDDPADHLTARLRFLSDATDVLAAALDDEAMFGQVARLAVPAMADWAAVHVLDGATGGVRRVAVVHRDPAKQATADKLLSPLFVRPDESHAATRALRTMMTQHAADGSTALAPDGPPEIVAVYEAMGTADALAVPMVARGRPVGVLILALGDSDRRYHDEDVSLAEELARRCALAVDNARLYQETRALLVETDHALALLDALFVNAPTGLAFFDLDGRYVRVNTALAEINGRAPEDHLGRRIDEVVPDVAGTTAALHRHVVETGEPVVDIEVEGTTPSQPGVRRSWLTSWFPVGTAGEALVGVGVVVREITDRKQAEAEVHRRVAQQAAVAEFGREALVGMSLPALYERALDVVTELLDVPYAAALHQVDNGQAIVRAVRGWPAEIVGTRVAAGRDSQAGYTLQANRPVIVRDVRNDPRFRPAQITLDNGLVSSISMVIRGDPLPYGVLSVHTTEPRDFTLDDVYFLRSIANVLAAAEARTEATEALRAERQRLRLALDAGRMGDWHWDVRTNELTWSESMTRLFGLEPGDAPPTYEGITALVHPDDREPTGNEARAAVAEERSFYVEYRVMLPDGSIRWVSSSGDVVRDDDGRVVAMIGVASDITERMELLAAERAARDEAEAAGGRLEFLAAASEALSMSLNYRRTLAKLANLVVPQLADWCRIDMVEEDRQPHMVTVAHIDPAKVERAREMQERYPMRTDAPRGPAQVLRTGQPDLLAEITDEMLVGAAVDEEHLALLREMGPRSIMIVPLVARGRPIGVVTLAAAESGRTFDEADLAFAVDLARRAATAIDNARLYQERSHVARALQQSLLPPEMPDVPGLVLADRYRPMSEVSEIGGDFYDVFEAADGSWCLVVGDVCGKGPDAAGTTGLARNTVRAVALHDPRPARVLELLNETLNRHDDARFCTVVFARVVPGDDGVTATVACGGHPLPLVVRQDGTVEAAGLPGTLLGAFDTVTLREVDLDLRPGDSIVFYTDGVTEARREGEVFGEQRLGQLLARSAGMRPKALADAIEDAVVAWQPEHRDDDLALLIAAVPST